MTKYISPAELKSLELATKNYPDIYEQLLELYEIDCLEDLLSYKYDECVKKIDYLLQKRI